MHQPKCALVSEYAKVLTFSKGGVLELLASRFRLAGVSVGECGCPFGAQQPSHLSVRH
jgi:hypothetical protein